MKIATWNVNSIRTRSAKVLEWLAVAKPDVLCLQETKVPDADFPREAMLEAGYHSAIWGQKAYNGVAILSRQPAENVSLGLGPGRPGEDEQTRTIAATIEGTRVVNVYVPNGAAAGTETYAYKMGWMKRLRALFVREHTPDQPIVLCGDFNVAPEDEDVHNPAVWDDRIMCTLGERERYRELLEWGFTDAFRHLVKEGGHFSWWDYRLGAFAKNRGLRIDFVLVTEPMVARLASASIDRETRKGKGTSDHAPVVVEIGS